MNNYDGYTESQTMTEARARRNQEWEAQRELCNQIVAELEPKITHIRYAVASAIVMPMEVTLTHAEVMAEIETGKRLADEAIENMRYMNKRISTDDGCGNDADLYDYARGG